MKPRDCAQCQAIMAADPGFIISRCWHDDPDAEWDGQKPQRTPEQLADLFLPHLKDAA